MKKVIKIFLLTLIASLMLTGCGFFEEEAEGVKDVKVSEVEESNDIKITVTYYDEAGTVTDYIIPAGVDGKEGLGIKAITSKKDVENARTIITIEYTDEERPAETLIVPDGTRILNIRSQYDPNTDYTYMYFEYSDGTESEAIRIPKGETGNGIDNEKTTFEVDEDGNTNVCITYTNGETVEFTIPSGVGISSITPSLTGGTYNLEIIYSNDEVETISFLRGAMWFEGSSNPNGNIELAEVAQKGDYFMDISHKKIYRLDEEEWIMLINFANDNDTVKVTFDLNDDSTSEASFAVGDQTGIYTLSYGTYFATGEYGPIPIPQRAGYEFVGWFTAKVVTNVTGQFNDLTPVFSNLTLYAQWKAIE